MLFPESSTVTVNGSINAAVIALKAAVDLRSLGFEVPAGHQREKDCCQNLSIISVATAKVPNYTIQNER